MTTVIDLDYKPAFPAGRFVERLDHSTLLLHPSNASWMEVNATGLLLADLADGKHAIKDIIAALARHYEVAEEHVTADVKRFFDVADQAGFLEIKKRPGLDPDQTRSGVSELFLHLLQRCNLQCPHCYTQSHEGFGQGPPLAGLFPVLDDCARNGFRTLTISGGEPLIYPGIEALLEHARKHYSIILLTNGTLITPALADRLTEACCLIQISLDGASPGIHDSIRGRGMFEKALHGIRLLQAAGAADKLVICSTVTRETLPDVPAMVDLASDLAVPRLRFLPLIFQGRAADSRESLLPPDQNVIDTFEYILPRLFSPTNTLSVSGFIPGVQLKSSFQQQSWCHIGRTWYLDFDGTISPCLLMKNYRWKIGNPYKESVRTILSRKMLDRFEQTISQRREKIERCRTCSWKHFCQAGCAGIALQQTGSVNRVDTFCDYRRYIFPRLFAALIEQRKQQRILKNKPEIR